MNISTLLEVLVLFFIIGYFLRNTAKDYEEDIKSKKSAKNKKKIAVIKLVDEKEINVVSKIKEIDSHFSEEYFLTGAKAAFKMIVSAFNLGEIDSIRNYISKDIYNSFDTVISERKSNELTSYFELISFNKAEIKDIKLTGNIATITVEFITQQVNYVKDINKEVVQGMENYVNKVVDVWTFTKDMKSKDPNWTLITTQNL